MCNDEPFDGKCISCEVDKAGNSEMLDKLQAWGHRCISVENEIPSRPRLHRLYSWDASSSGPVRRIHDVKELSFRLVHHLTIQTWRSAIDITQTLLSNNKKNKVTSDEAKERLVRSTPWIFKSLFCEGHSCTPIAHSIIKDMVLEAISGQSSLQQQDKDSVAIDCIRQVELLTTEEYQRFVESLKQLHAIIQPDADTRPLSPEECNKCHPVITAKFCVQPQPSSPSGTPTETTPIFMVSPNPPSCEDPMCVDGFVAAAIALRPSPDGNRSSQDVEMVESKDDGQIDVKVHELEGHVEMDAALAALLPEINAAAHGSDTENGTRRSSRKRKTRSDGITTHEFRLYPHDNLAKLKLLLLERANKVRRFFALLSAAKLFRPDSSLSFILVSNTTA